METVNLDPNLSTEQFQRELNYWFESHGVLSEVRSHLRKVMVSALQTAGAGLPARTHPSSPKTHALFLLVAEFLLREHCHYTMSVLTSEVSALTKFQQPKHKLIQGTKTLQKFKETEVEEILSALGLASSSELENAVEEYMLQQDQTCLLTCLLGALPELAARVQLRETYQRDRFHDEGGSKELPVEWCNEVTDILIKGKITSQRVAAVHSAIARVTAKELNKLLREETERNVKSMIEREVKIQENIERHEIDIELKLKEADNELETRRRIIDEELLFRQQQLANLAKEWRRRNETMVVLTEQVTVLEKTKTELEQELQDVKLENSNLKCRLKRDGNALGELKMEMIMLREKLEEMNKINSDFKRKIAEAQVQHPVQVSNRPPMDLDSSESETPIPINTEPVISEAWTQFRKLEDESTRIDRDYCACKQQFNLQKPEFDKFEHASKLPLTITKQEFHFSELRLKQPEPPKNRAQNKIPFTVRKTNEEIKTTKPIYTHRQLENHAYFMKSRKMLTELKNESLSLSSSTDSEKYETNLSPNHSARNKPGTHEEQILTPTQPTKLSVSNVSTQYIPLPIIQERLADTPNVSQETSKTKNIETMTIGIQRVADDGKEESKKEETNAKKDQPEQHLTKESLLESTFILETVQPAETKSGPASINISPLMKQTTELKRDLSNSESASIVISGGGITEVDDFWD